MNHALHYRSPLLMAWILLIKTPFAFAAANPDLSYYEQAAPSFTHEAPLELVLMQGSRWKREDIDPLLENTARIYAQCGVKIVVDKISEIQSNGIVDFDLEGYSDPSYVHPKNGTLEIAKPFAKDHATVFFIDHFENEYNSIVATSEPAIRAQRPDQQDALNSVWLTYEVKHFLQFSFEDGGFPSGYSPVAHELSHVLLNSGHVKDQYQNNLMHENFYSLNGFLTQAQCETLRSSPLIHPLKAPPKKACSEISSPLLGSTVFVYGASDCGTMASIVNKLDKVREAVSDLAPLDGIDFYMRARSDEIEYQDRNSFNASLIATYSANGSDPLLEKQADALWMHELGHGILNAKLVEDWPWYKGRMDIFNTWEYAIRSSYEHPEDSSYSEIINKQIKLYASYPNILEFDDMILPYHELFADTVAILYTRDPRAISFGLADPQDLLGKNASESDRLAMDERDYSLPHPLENWKETKPHGMLAPVRSHFWKIISSHPEATNQELLRFLYNAIKSELLLRSADPKLWNLSVEDVNSRLIKKLNW